MRTHKRHLDCSGMTIAEAESYGSELATFQRDIMWWLGDLARYAETRWPDSHTQVWPEWVSPGMIARAAGVARAYPKPEDREHDCTFTQYMQHAGKPDRQELLREIVERGLTSDESRKVKPVKSDRWLLAIDVHYFLHRFWFSGAGVESAMSVSGWVERTVNRLREKGLTDVVCAFDSRTNHRKELVERTPEFGDEYKPRPPKDPELGNQLTLVRDLLERDGLCCVSLEGMEADDIMASYAAQFDGRVTIMSQDKDLKQCLSEKCNMLLDVTWEEDSSSGEAIANYKWLSAKQHTEDTGIPPEKWTEFQSIMGDNTDGIKGAVGIGTKGAADLVKEFGTVENAIAAAKAGDERIKPAKRQALIEFEPKLEVTRQLVTLRTDLKLKENTRLT